MLGKLLKYELMAEWRKFAAIYAGMLVLALSVLLFGKGLARLGENPFIGLMSSLLLGAFTILSILAFWMVFVFACIRFYKNLFRDEGYLMHTLPVSPWNHIWAKMIATCLWSAATLVMFVLCVSIASGTFTWIEESLKALTEVSENLDAAQEGFAEFFKSYIINVAVYMVLSPPFMQIYLGFCIAVGSLFNKNRILMSVLTALAVNFASQIISTAVMTVMGMAKYITLSPENLSMTQFFDMFNYLMIVIGIISLVMYAAMLYFTYYIMNKKLNLE